MSEPSTKICIFPGCERPAAAAHELGGPQPSFCDLEAHNALTAHQERLRLEVEPIGASLTRTEAPTGAGAGGGGGASATAAGNRDEASA